MISFFLDRPLFANLFFALLLVLGVMTLRKVPMEAFPEMSFGAVMVTTPWPGVTAYDVEQQVTLPLEEKIAEVDHILNLTSVSTSGLSQIRVKFDESLSDEDYEKLHTQVQNKIQEVQNLPTTIKKSRAVLMRTQDWRPAVSIALSGSVSEKSLKDTAKWLKHWLQSVPGIQKVEISGEREGRIYIDLDPEKLARQRLNPSSILSKLNQALPHQSSGILESDFGGILIRTVGEFRTQQEILDFPVKVLPNGAALTIADLGSVKYGFERATGYRKQDGQLALVLNVHKEREANALELIPRIKARIFERKAEMLPGIRLSYFNDSTTTIIRRLGVLGSSLSLGIVLVFFVLWIFLGLKNSLLTVLGIPFSFLTGFLILNFYGITLNEITVFSLILVSGMVVDDAIVILENMVAHSQRGLSLLDAARKGAKEVFWPVFASTLTTICAFMPMVMMTGEIGRVMIIIPITVTIMLAASLIEAFLILPGHFVELSKIKMLRHFSASGSEGVLEFWKKLEKHLRKLLYIILKRPFFWLITGTLGVAFIAYLPILTGHYHLRESLFIGDVTTLWVDVECRSEYTLEQTMERTSPIEERVKDFLADGIANLTTYVGGGLDEEYRFLRGSNLAQITVDLQQKYASEMDITQIVSQLSDFLGQATFQGVTSVKVRKFQTGPPIGKPVSKRCYGNSLEELYVFGLDLVTRLKKLESIKNPDLDLKLGLKRIDLVVKDHETQRYGLSRRDVRSQVTMAVEGLPAGVLHWEGEEIDLMIRTRQKDINLASDLGKISIMNNAGESILLENLAEAQSKQTFVRRIRFNQSPSISVFADLREEKNISVKEANTEVNQVISSMLKEYPGIEVKEGTGEVTETQKSLDSLKQAFVAAALLMFIILATQFNSISQPFLILLAIPFSFFGVLFGIGLFDFPFTMATYMAMVGLAGVVVNDTIVLLDFYNRLKEKMSHQEAVIEAACRRLRPICLTTVTTILGLLPVLFGVGGFSMLWSPMAVAVCFGIVTATIATIFLIPLLLQSLDLFKVAKGGGVENSPNRFTKGPGGHYD